MNWPWKRSNYAKIIRYLHLSGAKLIVFNSFFSEESIYQRFGEKDDEEFVKAVKEAGNVIIGYQFFKPVNDFHTNPNNEKSKSSINKFSINTNKISNENNTPKFTDYQAPIYPLTKNIKHLGALNSFIDNDNTFRRIPLLINYYGDYYTSLSLATILSYNNTNVNIENDHLFIKEMKIPLDNNGLLRLKYYGKNDVYEDYYHYEMMRIFDHINNLYIEYSRHSYKEKISYKQLFQNSKYILKMRDLLKDINPQLVNNLSEQFILETTPELFKNKIVLIGSIAPSLYDIQSTPFNKREAGIHLHATAIDNLLQNDFLIEFRENYYFLFIFIFLTFLTTYFQNRISIKWSFFYLLILIISIFIISIYIYSNHNILIDILSLTALLIAIFIMNLIIDHFQTYKLLQSYSTHLEERNKEFTRLSTKIHNSIKNKLDTSLESLSLIFKQNPEMNEKVENKLLTINNLVTHCSNETRNILFAVENQECSFNRLVDEIKMRSELSLINSDIIYSINTLFAENDIIRANAINFILDSYSEILTNLKKHSKATEVIIDLNYNNKELVLKVQDNGIGFDLEKERSKPYSYGLKIIDKLAEENQAQFNIYSELGAGTTFFIKTVN